MEQLEIEIKKIREKKLFSLKVYCLNSRKTFFQLANFLGVSPEKLEYLLLTRNIDYNQIFKIKEFLKMSEQHFNSLLCY